LEKIQAKKIRFVNEKTLIVAVDIGKGVNLGYARCPNGVEVKPFEFYNNGEGFKKLWERIWGAKVSHGLEAVVVGFESTGAYGEPLVQFLAKRPVRLVQVNPLHTKRLKELEGNSPAKTDRKDPKVIADIIGLGHALTVVIPEGPAAELRRLTQGRERALKRRTAYLNQLQDLVFLLFPEFLQVLKNLKSRTAQYLLRHVPHPQDILGMSLEALTVTLRRVSRGKLGREQAQALYAAAQCTVGLREGRRGMSLEMGEILSGLEGLESYILQIEQEMGRYLAQIPYSQWLLSMKGMGEITVAGLIGEVGDFRQFDTLSEVMKLAGLDLYEISSGKHKGRRRISKRGRPLMRKLLYFAAINMVRKGGAMRGPYERFLQRGMLKGKALVAIARKLLRILFALVRDQREYQPDYRLDPSFQRAA